MLARRAQKLLRAHAPAGAKDTSSRESPGTHFRARGKRAHMPICTSNVAPQGTRFPGTRKMLLSQVAVSTPAQASRQLWILRRGTAPLTLRLWCEHRSQRRRVYAQPCTDCAHEQATCSTRAWCGAHDTSFARETPEARSGHVARAPRAHLLHEQGALGAQGRAQELGGALIAGGNGESLQQRRWRAGREARFPQIRAEPLDDASSAAPPPPSPSPSHPARIRGRSDPTVARARPSPTC